MFGTFAQLEADVDSYLKTFQIQTKMNNTTNGSSVEDTEVNQNNTRFVLLIKPKFVPYAIM